MGEGEDSECEVVDVIEDVGAQVRRDMVVTAIQQEVLDLIGQAFVHGHPVSAHGDLYPCIGTHWRRAAKVLAVLMVRRWTRG